jgi:hypothetical protein
MLRQLDGSMDGADNVVSNWKRKAVGGSAVRAQDLIVGRVRIDDSDKPRLRRPTRLQLPIASVLQKE